MFRQNVGSDWEVCSPGLVDPLLGQGGHPVLKPQLGQQIWGAGLEYLLEVVEDHLGDGDVQQHIYAGQIEIVEEADEEDGQGRGEKDGKCVFDYYIYLLQPLADGLHSDILSLAELNFLIKLFWLLWGRLLRGRSVAHNHNIVDHQLHSQNADWWRSHRVYFTGGRVHHKISPQTGPAIIHQGIGNRIIYFVLVIFLYVYESAVPVDETHRVHLPAPRCERAHHRIISQVEDIDGTVVIGLDDGKFSISAEGDCVGFIGRGYLIAREDVVEGNTSQSHVDVYFWIPVPDDAHGGSGGYRNWPAFGCKGHCWADVCADVNHVETVVVGPRPFYVSIYSGALDEYPFGGWNRSTSGDVQ